MLSRMEASPISGDDLLRHDQLQVERLQGRRTRPRGRCARHMGSRARRRSLGAPGPPGARSRGSRGHGHSNDRREPTHETTTRHSSRSPPRPRPRTAQHATIEACSTRTRMGFTSRSHPSASWRPRKVRLRSRSHSGTRPKPSRRLRPSSRQPQTLRPSESGSARSDSMTSAAFQIR